MLYFNKYPPQEPGDIELTEGAEKRIVNINGFFRVGHLNPQYDELVRERAYKLEAYGESIGRLVAAAIEEPDASLAEEIIRPIYDKVESLTENHLWKPGFNLSQGVHEGVQDEISKRKVAA